MIKKEAEEKLEVIQVIRNLRKRLGSFDVLSNHEKSLVLKSLNSYEDDIKFEFAVNNNLKKQYGDMGLFDDVEEIHVPYEEDTPTYPEFSVLSDLESYETNLSVISNLVSNLDQLNLSENENMVLTNSMKRYQNFLSRQIAQSEQLEDLYSNRKK